MLFLNFNSSTVNAQTNVNVASYQGWQYSSGNLSAPGGSNSFVTNGFYFDRAYLTVSHTSGKFRANLTAKANSNYDLNVYTAAISYTNELTENSSYTLTAGKFDNVWYRYTSSLNNYAFTRPLYDRLPLMFSAERNQSGISASLRPTQSTLINATFTNHSGDSVKSLLTSAYWENNRLSAGVFFGTRFGNSWDSTLSFGAALSYIPAKYVSLGAEFVYLNSAPYNAGTRGNSWSTSAWTELTCKRFEQWSLLLKGTFVNSNTNITASNLISAESHLIFRPNSLLNLGLNYGYDWDNRGLNSQRSYNIGISSGIWF